MGIKRGREEHKSQVLWNEMFRKIFTSTKNAEVRSEEYYTTKYFVISSGYLPEYLYCYVREM
jgi:hypothetical protein